MYSSGTSFNMCVDGIPYNLLTFRQNIIKTKHIFFMFLSPKNNLERYYLTDRKFDGSTWHRGWHVRWILPYVSRSVVMIKRWLVCLEGVMEGVPMHVTWKKVLSWEENYRPYFSHSCLESMAFFKSINKFINCVHSYITTWSYFLYLIPNKIFKIVMTFVICVPFSRDQK